MSDADPRAVRVTDELAETVSLLREENKRLRAALEELVSTCPACRGTGKVEVVVFLGSGRDWETRACRRCAGGRRALR